VQQTERALETMKREAQGRADAAMQTWAKPEVVIEAVPGRDGFWMLSAAPTNMRGYISEVEPGRFAWDLHFGSVSVERACPNHSAAVYWMRCEAYRMLREVGFHV
jgi:hypothetical protein